MKRVILDTNYWISLKRDPQRFKEFYETASSEDVKVILSFGNFIDLVKAEEQDTLSKIIAGTADYCLPAMSEGDDYDISRNPIALVPDEDYRRYLSRVTQDMDMVETLQAMFRDSGWGATEEYFEGIEQYKELYDEFGHNNLKGHAFREQLEEDGDGEYILQPNEVDPISYVKVEVYLQRLRLMDPQENPKENDIADLEICTQAILSDCNMLLMEEKWVNEKLVERVLEAVESDKELEVYKDFQKFLSDLNQ
jgi:hypothetical protein